jgi:uncharacterized protein with FMN-binding domain
LASFGVEKRPDVTRNAAAGSPSQGARRSSMRGTLKRLLLSVATIAVSASYVLSQASGFGLTGASEPPTATIAETRATPLTTAQANTVRPATALAPTRTPAEAASFANAAPAAVVAAAPVAAPATTAIALQPTQPAGQYVDGTYNGPAANASYGYVQVQAVITNGQLSAINVLQYPNHTNRSRRISDIALPRLETEAIRNQTASVSMISGATLTVRAFRTSLAQALNAARA